MASYKKPDLLADIEKDKAVSIEALSGLVMDAYDIQDMSEISKTDVRRAKDALSIIRTRASLALDQRKLHMAEIAMTNIETYINFLADPKVAKRVKQNILTPKDCKDMADAAMKQLQVLQILMRLDSVDGQGSPARLKLGVEFSGGSKSKARLMVEMEDG